MARDVSPSEVDVLEVNISCPTRDPNGGNFALHEEHTFKSCAASARRRTSRSGASSRPMPATSSPSRERRKRRAPTRSSSRIRFSASRSTSNTFRPAIGNKFGGLSGPGIKPIIVRMVYQCAKAVKIPDHRLRRHRQGRGRGRIHARRRERGHDRLPYFPQSLGHDRDHRGSRRVVRRRGFARVADLTGAMIDEAPRETYAAAAAPIG